MITIYLFIHSSVYFILFLDKKGLGSLYKRVDKHFAECSELLRVVWYGIQEEVIRTHERFTMTINKCYPNSNIRMEFSTDDLLTLFFEYSKKT